jgi:hypothetical protein
VNVESKKVSVDTSHELSCDQPITITVVSIEHSLSNKVTTEDDLQRNYRRNSLPMILLYNIFKQ